jgi:hypothetical protein
MSKKENFEIGSRVVTGTGAGKKGIVRFIGETEVREELHDFDNLF